MMQLTTFDGWDARYCGDALALPGWGISEDVLMHWRTKGSKNGVRRYQQPDGTWTPLGLRERRAREGWGESRKERRAEKKVARAERKAAKAEARAQRSAERREQLIRNKKRSGLEGLSDDELRRKIDRAKLESEYKELTKSQLLKTGEKVLEKYIEGKAQKADRELAKAKQEIDLKRIEADIVRAKEGTNRARQEFKKAKEERKTWETSAKLDEQKTALKRAKIDWKNTTLHGGIIRRINAMLTSGVSEKYKAIRIQQGKNEADSILAGYNAGKKKSLDKSARKLAKQENKAEKSAAKAEKRATNKHNRELVQTWKNQSYAQKSWQNYKNAAIKRDVADTADRYMQEHAKRRNPYPSVSPKKYRGKHA